MIDLRSLSLENMKNLMEELDEKPFRAEQVFSWVHEKGFSDIDGMSNLSKNLRSRLKENTFIAELSLKEKQSSKDGTKKYLFELYDGSLIECVLMQYKGDLSKQRNTLCISSQVGCQMGCSFCATGKLGFKRDLTAGEIVGQVYEVNRIEQEDDEDFKVNNIVFMGMGEPLLNYDNVLASIVLLNEEKGQNIGIRRITISTCGIVPKIVKLADENLDIVLAISLHAVSDSLRSTIMPVNKSYSLKNLKDACLYYQERTKKRISFEYALVEGFNDTKEDVLLLKDFLSGLKGHINLIPINPVVDEFQRPNKNKLYAFMDLLEKEGLSVSIREEKGTDIDGACGQLGKKFLE